MFMGYRVLKFEPDIKNKTPKEHILWIGQMEDMDANHKRDLKNLKEVCSHDHRFTLTQWEEKFNAYDYKVVKNYDHDFVMEYLLEDGDFIVACIQLFACDVETSYFSLEVPQDEIIGLLLLLDLKKSGCIFPFVFLQQLEYITEKIKLQEDDNRNVLAQLRLLKEIALHCQAYEVDIKWSIAEID
jgi:hypothetical protein